MVVTTQVVGLLLMMGLISLVALRASHIRATLAQGSTRMRSQALALGFGALGTFMFPFIGRHWILSLFLLILGTAASAVLIAVFVLDTRLSWHAARSRQLPPRAANQGLRDSYEIVVYRRSNIYAMLATIKICVDGKVVGAVNDGETTRLSVPAGRHQVSVKLDWTRSRAVLIDSDKGASVSMECSTTGFLLSFLAPRRALELHVSA